MEKMDESKKIMQVKSSVLADLQRYLEGHAALDEPSVDDNSLGGDEPADTSASSGQDDHHDKVSVEFSPEEPEGRTNAVSKEQPAAETPPIKKDIEDHFNARDASGRLLNVFKQYYTCLNETCHGTVRVTMKDGICSLWNYDEWEEFAFIDILDDELRIAVDTRYTNDLSSLDFCEVARLLAARRNLIAIQIGDLNKTMLGVLTKAFSEVGQAAG
jgi:hypothetical protein